MPSTPAFNARSKRSYGRLVAAFCAAVLTLLGFTVLPGALVAKSVATLWGTSAPPRVALDSDTPSVELGTRFTAKVDGLVTAIRFYKVRGMTGIHSGSLWTGAGARLVTVNFTGESARGWQSAKLASPIRLRAGDTYVVSYHVPPGGGYGATRDFTGVSNPSMLAVSATSSGVYTYGSSVTFPQSSWRSSQYWADVEFKTQAMTPSPSPTHTVTQSAAPPQSVSPTQAANPTLTNSPPPSVYEEFGLSGAGWPKPPDGKWRIAGDWTGTGSNLLMKNNASLVSSFGGLSGGFLTLTSRANQLSGGEIQTMNGVGGKYGYFETRMKVSPTPGVCNSFFWIGENYTLGEIDIEFLTNESWITSPDRGQVHFVVHAADGRELQHVMQLGFNPSRSFHRYGFLHTPDKIVFTVDGQPTWTVPDTIDMKTNIANTGYIMMNTWTGDPNWGGGPPATDSVVAYDWVKYYAGASAIPTS